MVCQYYVMSMLCQCQAQVLERAAALASAATLALFEIDLALYVNSVF